MQPMVSISHATTISPVIGIRSFSVRSLSRQLRLRFFPEPLYPACREEAAFPMCQGVALWRDARLITPIFMGKLAFLRICSIERVQPKCVTEAIFT